VRNRAARLFTSSHPHIFPILLKRLRRPSVSFLGPFVYYRPRKIPNFRFVGTFVSMKVLTILFLAVFGLITFGARAQSPGDESREVVMYDPLFWKEELKIKFDQSRKIEQINNEFYENIRQNRSDNEEENTATLERGLEERSQKIFETLLPKQRRKLEKIIDKTAPVTAAP